MTLAIALAVLAGTLLAWVLWAIRDDRAQERMEREAHSALLWMRYVEAQARLQRAMDRADRFHEIAVDRHPLGHVTRTTRCTDPDRLISQLADEGR